MIITASTAPPPTRPQRYYTETQRAALLEKLIQYEAEHGTVPNALVARLARAIDRSPGHVRRMLRAERKRREDPDAGRHSYEDLPVPMDFLVFAASLNGNLHRAWQEFAWQEPRPHYSTVVRRVDTIDTALATVLRKGIAAFDRYLSVGIFESEYRNERWIGDETHIPVPCRGPRGSRIDNLQLLTYFDDFSRLVVNANVNVAYTDGEKARAAFARAVVGRDLGGIRIGGAPDILAVDHAEALKGIEMSRVVDLTDVTALELARPHTAQDKAKLERWHGTIKYSWLLALAGFLKGSVRTIYEDRLGADGFKERVRIERAYSELPTADLPDVKALTLALYELIDHYNTDHIVSTIGMTPWQKYASDTSLQIEIGAEAMWDMAIRLPHTYKVEHRGINVDGRYYDAAPLEFMRTKAVTARVLPGMHEILMVGDGDRVICQVTRKQDENERDRRARAARNSERQSFARRVLARGAQQAKDETRSTDDDAVETRARSRGKRRGPTLANDADLLGLAG